MGKGDGKTTSMRIQSSPGSSSAAHAAKQRERFQQGLRILVRIVARAHMGRQASQATLDPDQRAGG